MSVSRSTLGTVSVLAAKEAPTLEAMRRLSTESPRYGYRRIRIFLQREGHAMSIDRCYRLWCQAGLQVPRKRPRRRIDACANGQPLKCLTVIDEWTRECLAIEVAGSIRSRQVVDVLKRRVSLRGAPRYMRSDNGPEFVSKAILQWMVDEGMHTA